MRSASRRRSRGFLEPGCGFGGSCLPKDVTALIGQGNEKGLALPLLKSVLDINKGQPDEMMRLIGRHFRALDGVKVTVLGIAFKPDTDDMRETPAIPLIRRLEEKGAHITAYDPIARPTDNQAFARVRLASSLREAIADAEIIVLVNSMDEFTQLSDGTSELGREPLVVDGRRMLEARFFAHYEGIGR